MSNWNWTSQSARVNETISNLMSLDDVTFDRVMKRCCDTNRPVVILKQILGSWSKVLSKKRKSGADLTDQVRGCYTGEDYLVASAKEEDIVTVMKDLHDLEFKDVCVRCFEKGRPSDFLKSVDNHWLDLTKVVRKKPTAPPPPESLVKTKSEVSDPDVEIIDLSPSSSPGVGDRIAPSRSPSSRRKSTPVRIAPQRPSASPPPRRRTAPRRNSSQPPAKQKKPEEQEKKRYSNQLFHEKLALTAEGIWTSDMEINWMVMEIEENKLTKEFEELGQRLSDFPEQHPKYAEEWTQFWENKAAVVEEAGGDAENYDYIPEWKEYWARRMEALLRLDFNNKLDEIRRKYGMDLDALNRLRMKKLGCHIIPTDDIQQDEQIEVQPQPLHGGKSTWRIASSTDQSHDEPMSTQSYTPEETQSDGLEGCDLVQILRRMTILETQLSFLAPKVLEFFKMAEQMELSGRGNSNVLLLNQEFLDLLYKCRYRFQALIQADVLPIDVLGFMKHSVKKLGKILESPKCQAVLPNPRQARKNQRSPSPTLMMNPMNPFSELRRRQSETSVRPNIFAENIPEPPPILPAGAAQKHPFNTATESGRAELSEAIMKRMEHLSEDQKLRIVEIMTTTLVREGRERINDQDLVEFVMGSVDPLIKSIESQGTPPRIRPPSPSPFESGSGPGVMRNPSGNEHQLEWIPPTRQLSPMHWKRNQMYSEELETVPQLWTGDLESGTTRTVGIAIPPLPLSHARATAATPPPRSEDDYCQVVRRRRGSFGERKPGMKPRLSDQFAKPGCYSEWPDDVQNSLGSDENGYSRRRRPGAGQSDEVITLY